MGLEIGAPLTQNNHFFDTAEGLLRVVTTPPGGQSCVNRARLALLRESD